MLDIKFIQPIAQINFKNIKFPSINILENIKINLTILNITVQN